MFLVISWTIDETTLEGIYPDEAAAREVAESFADENECHTAVLGPLPSVATFG